MHNLIQMFNPCLVSSIFQCDLKTANVFCHLPGRGMTSSQNLQPWLGFKIWSKNISPEMENLMDQTHGQI